MQYLLILFPFIGALIGWLTHQAGIALLFHPRTPKKIMGIRFHGIIPRRREELATRIGQFAARSFSFDSLKEKVNDPRHWEVIKPVVETHIDEFLRVKLAKQMPMISMFIGDKTIESMKGIFMNEIGTMFPEVIGGFANNVGKEFNVEKTVKEKLLQVPSIEFEKIIKKNLAQPLRSITLLGAISGFIIGLIFSLAILFGIFQL